jgi:hypothetical protein
LIVEAGDNTKGFTLAFSLAQFASTRPYLYHLTSQSNFDRLLRSRELISASELLKVSNNEEWISRKRCDTVTITVDGESIELRDQQPLYAGKTVLEGGWSFADLVRQLNERVFFWPGWGDKPVSYAERHFERYKGERPVIMRVGSQDLFNHNAHVAPLFCKYNSGSPRTTQGTGSPRGPNTFIECHRASFTASNVVEVTFNKSVRLPRAIEAADSPWGPWKSH